MNSVKNYFFIVYVVLAGCSSVPELQHDLSNKMQNTVSFVEMKSQPIKSSDNLTVVLGKESSVFTFDEGKSYYETISIPEPRLPRKLIFKTYYSTSYLPSANILTPTFIFLNESKQPISKAAPQRFIPGVDLWLGGYFEGYVLIPSDASYLVIYTTSAQTPELVSMSENGTIRTLPHAPTGKLSLTLSAPNEANHDFSTAIIKDTVKVYNSKKADFFYVAEINDKSISNSLVKTDDQMLGVVSI